MSFVIVSIRKSKWLLQKVCKVLCRKGFGIKTGAEAGIRKDISEAEGVLKRYEALKWCHKQWLEQWPKSRSRSVSFAAVSGVVDGAVDGALALAFLKR